MLEIINVSYYYKTNKSKKILDEVSMQFEEGVFYAIVGPSGSGKTTFLSLLAGLDTPIDGMILYDGMPQNIENIIFRWYSRITILLII